MRHHINHIGIAVRDLDQALATYAGALGMRLRERKTLPERGLEIAFLEADTTLVELLAPLGETSQIAKFLEKRGEGVHHLCLEVDDIRAELATLKAAGLAPLSPEPELGAEGLPVAFLHPRSLGGVLVELIEKH